MRARRRSYVLATIAAAWTYDALKGGNRAFDVTNTVSLSGITANQKLVAIVTLRQGRGITTPSGWTAGPTFAGETGGTTVITFTKTAAGGETSVIFDEATAVFGDIDATVIAFTGSGQIGATAENTPAFEAQAVAPSVTVDANAYVLRVFCADSDPFTITAPGGVTSIRNSGNRDGHLLTIEGPLSAGAAGTKTATYSGPSFLNAVSIEMEPL